MQPFLKTLIALSLASSSTSALAAECLRYEPATSTVSGKIHIVHGYGPPNFGENPETDAKTVYTILELDHSICVTGGDGEVDEDRSDVRQIELLDGRDVPSSARNPAEGARVSASGKLMMSGTDRGSPAEVMMLYTGLKKE